MALFKKNETLEKVFIFNNYNVRPKNFNKTRVYYITFHTVYLFSCPLTKLYTYLGIVLKKCSSKHI